VKDGETPRLFRVLLPAKDLETSRRFYESLFGTRGRQVAPGRIYFDCGPVLLGILDYSAAGGRRLPRQAEAVYFATGDLEGVYDRARKLGCLSPGLIHNDPTNPLGEMVVRPWGERSFYADDPSGNALCFVDDTTLFTGTARQVAAFLRKPQGAPRAPPSAPAKRSGTSRTRRYRT
jgi:predicted enzyme related to lactoylglutathione lyase